MAKNDSITKITINQAKHIISKMMDKNEELINSDNKDIRKSQLSSPIFLHSSPGLGKSSIIAQLKDSKSKKEPFGFVDLRLSSMEASDLCGVPYVSHAGKETEEAKFSIPQWFPSKQRVAEGVFPKRGFLFFDELSNAPLAVQHASYRIILDREIQTGVELADGWMIVAAGNLPEDKTGAKKIAPALANRFSTHLFIEPNTEEFLKYAYAKNLHHYIIGYLRFQSDHLYRFDPSKNDVAFASPRSWEEVSNILEWGLSSGELGPVLNGCLGVGVASEFMGFMKLYGKLPDFEKIMSGEDKTYKIPSDALDLRCAVASSLIECMLKNSSDSKKLENLQYVFKQIPEDFKTMIFKTICEVADNETLADILHSSMDNFHDVINFIDMVN